mmetsp:Transcript_27836/g.57191  ORF Transcript_27836/g.57191 Transcript_27836/m.57191 type:complete len:268 (-) Transcript_27836:8-811(-)
MGATSSALKAPFIRYTRRGDWACITHHKPRGSEGSSGPRSKPTPRLTFSTWRLSLRTRTAHSTQNRTGHCPLCLPLIPRTPQLLHHSNRHTYLHLPCISSTAVQLRLRLSFSVAVALFSALFSRISCMDAPSLAPPASSAFCPSTACCHFILPAGRGLATTLEPDAINASVEALFAAIAASLMPCFRILSSSSSLRTERSASAGDAKDAKLIAPKRADRRSMLTGSAIRPTPTRWVSTGRDTGVKAEATPPKTRIKVVTNIDIIDVC